MNKNAILFHTSKKMLKKRNKVDKFSFKLSDLVFLAKLDLNLELTAFEEKGKGNKFYWVLHIKTEHSGSIKQGLLHGARGEIRKFSQLNALVEACRQYAIGCKEFKVKFR